MVQNFSITRFSVYQKDSKKILNQQNFVVNKILIM